MEPTQSILYYLEQQKHFRALRGSSAVDSTADEQQKSLRSDQVYIDQVAIACLGKRNLDRPDYLPAEKIKAGLTEIVLGCLLFAGLIAFCLDWF
jgi:hypothetical protein